MKKWIAFFAWLLVFSSPGNGWTQAVPAPGGVTQDAIMKPDDATRRRWYEDYLMASQAYIDPLIAETLEWGPKPILLDRIRYTPTERNQVACGNCWVWAGTGVIETLHNLEHGVSDRLSIQFFNSCWNSTDYPAIPVGSYACDGGSLSDFVDFYNDRAFRPWSNTNAHFQDTAGGTSSSVACSSVGSEPKYSGSSDHFEAVTIDTTGGSVSQATAIANIKNVLNQGKGVYFGYDLADDADWDGFKDHWHLQTETDIWDPDPYCGHTWVTGEGGGHGVVIVGYNDNDANPDNHYWIVLNSWGTYGGQRPNGLFRMKMNMDYKCTLNDGGDTWYSRRFQTVNVLSEKDGFFDYGSIYMAAKGATTYNIYVRKKNSLSATWGTWFQITGTTSHPPVMASFISKLYMVVKGVGTNKIWLRSMDYTGAWSGWTEVSGSTSAAPALVVYRNRLYVFVKGVASGQIWYNSMGTNGVWSGWLSVAGASAIDSPAVVVMNDRIILYQVDGAQDITYKVMSNDGTWGEWTAIPFNLKTSVGVSATVWRDRIVIVARGEDGVPGSSRISWMQTGQGTYYSFSPWQLIGGKTSQKPYISWGPKPDTFYVTVKGNTTRDMWENHYYLDPIVGYAWSGWTKSAGGSTHAATTSTYEFGNYPP